MSLLDHACAGDPALAAELDGLAPDQLALVEEELALRKQAAALAAELGLDAQDVRHQLKHLQRTPTERLRLGLAHGRRRPRLPR